MSGQGRYPGPTSWTQAAMSSVASRSLPRSSQTGRAPAACAAAEAGRRSRWLIRTRRGSPRRERGRWPGTRSASRDRLRAPWCFPSSSPGRQRCGRVPVPIEDRAGAGVDPHQEDAPVSAVTESRRAWPEPVRALVACGRIRDTKPITPTQLTRAAVSSAVAESRARRVRASRTPSPAAASSPKAKASRVRTYSRQTAGTSQLPHSRRCQPS